MLPINRNPGARELRVFARLWFPLFVAALGAIIWWRSGSPLAAAVFWAIGAAFAALVLSSREAARIVFVGLITVSYPVGLVISTMALGAMFYLVFTPLGFLMRLAGRDPLRLRARHEPSHWTPHEPMGNAERAFRQY